MLTRAAHQACCSLILGAKYSLLLLLGSSCRLRSLSSYSRGCSGSLFLCFEIAVEIVIKSLSGDFSVASFNPVALEFLIEVICGLLGILRQALTAFLAEAITLALLAAAFFVLALVTSFLMISAFVAAFLVLLKLLLSALTAVAVSVLTPFPQALD